MTWENSYLVLLQKILDEGVYRPDRTGTGTRALFGERLEIDLSKGFPAITTKKLVLKATIAELLWFIEGSSDERRLAEILHGTRDLEKSTFWTANANAEYWKPKALYDGDLGQIYGVQWRSWQQYIPERKSSSTKTIFEIKQIDQLHDVIQKIKTNPYDRRLIVSAWNVAELHEMALPPCHIFFQFFVYDNKLSCQMYMRSVDTFLGLPVNIASYALLTHLIAQVTELEVHKLILILGDTHIYKDHFDAVQEQLKRTPYSCPKLVLNDKIKNIDDFKMEDISLEGYEFHPLIFGKMSV